MLREMSEAAFVIDSTVAPERPRLALVEPPVSPPLASEGPILRAEAAIEAQRYQEAVDLLSELGASVSWSAAPSLELRKLLAESWARMYLGEVERALSLLERAQTIAERAEFTDVDRADIVYRLGCCRYKLSQIPTAIALFTVALELCDHTLLPCDRLRAHALEWRARSYRRQREWDSARADIERALELADRLGDRLSAAHVYFQASLVAQRTKHWLLARYYAERALEIYDEFGDRVNAGKLLNNLGGLCFLLGRPEEAVAYLQDSFRVALEVDSRVDAAYAVNSLAQVLLRSGDARTAEEKARTALELLGGRVDLIEEIGNAQLVLGRALLEQARYDEADDVFAACEESFRRLTSTSHLAAAWMAQGELATRRGDSARAIDLYRRSAEALQDFDF